MKKHLYNSRLGKVRWFIDRFGASEVFFKPLRTAFAPLIIPTLPRGGFTFGSQRPAYFYHRYNMTWACERCVEVPIALQYLEQFQGRPVLEIGNVLSHYVSIRHDVLDKFEKAEGVINQDIVDFNPGRKYALVLSISTFEHIGFDDEAEGGSAEKIQAAIASSKRLLEADGKLVLTVPMGYNPELDRLIRGNELPSTQEFFLKRSSRLRWEPCSRSDALLCRYRRPFPYANAILVAEFSH